MAKLYFNYGAMNAGKSTILLQAAYNYEERGMRTLLLKPTIDDRCSDAHAISSRIGIKGQASNFCNDKNLDDYIRSEHAKAPLDCVFIDEAQFLTRGSSLATCTYCRHNENSRHVLRATHRF